VGGQHLPLQGDGGKLMTEPVHAALLDHQVLEEIEMSTNLMIIASDSSAPSRWHKGTPLSG
jgi:hypothetical protein